MIILRQKDFSRLEKHNFEISQGNKLPKRLNDCAEIDIAIKRLGSNNKHDGKNPIITAEAIAKKKYRTLNSSLPYPLTKKELNSFLTKGGKLIK